MESATSCTTFSTIKIPITMFIDYPYFFLIIILNPSQSFNIFLEKFDLYLSHISRISLKTALHRKYVECRDTTTCPDCHA